MAVIGSGGLILFDGGGGGGSPSYVQIGSNVDDGWVKFGLRGTLNAYTCKRGNAPSGGEAKYLFSASELDLYMTRGSNLVNTTTPLYVFRFRVYLEDTLLRTIQCHAGNVMWQSWDWISFRETDFNVYRVEHTFDLATYKQYFGGNPYADTWPTYVNPSGVASSGTYSIYVEVDYEVSGTAYPGQHTVRKQVGRITFDSLELNSISLNTNGVTKKFYKNSNFSSSGLVISANYYYKSAYGGNSAESINVTSSASVSVPTMTTTGSKTITVSYGGKTATYTINVIGIATVSGENTETYYKYLNEAATNPGLPTSVTITYTDSSSRTFAPDSSTFAWLSGDFNAIGERSWTYKAYDAYTGEWGNGACTKYVKDIASLSVKTDPTTTTYQTNNTFSTSGLVLTANYSDAGNKDITASSSPIKLSDVTISSPNMTTVGSKSVTTTYRTKSASFNITVHGLTSIRLYVPDSLKKRIKGDSSSSFISGLQIFATSSDETEIEIPQAGNSNFTVAINTANVNISKNGTYAVSVTVTHEGNSITASYNVEVYSLDSLTLSDYKSEFIHTGAPPTFSVGSLVVTGHFSDNTERALSSSEYTVSAPSNMEVGTRSVTISATIGTTISATYTITIVQDYPASIESVDLTNWSDTFVQGNSFSKVGIKVKVTMNSGLVGKEVDFTTSLDGDVFGTDITDATTTFSIYVATSGDPITIPYNSEKILSGKTLTAKYDKLNSISVNAGSESSALRLARAGDQFTDLIDTNTKIVVTATYEYGGDKIIPRGSYTLSKPVGEAWTKDNMGSNTITVSFSGETTTYTIVVSKLFSIEVATSRDPNRYNRYETLDTSELTITRKYTHDGTNAEATGSTIAVNKVTLSGSYNQLVPNNQDGLTTDIGFSYTEAGATATATMVVTVVALTSVALNQSKYSINYGENFALVGKTITITFNTTDQFVLTIGSGNTVAYTLNGVSQSSTLSFSLDSLVIKNKVENVTVGLTFGSATKYATFTIHCIYLDHIDLDASYYTAQTLYAGDPIAYENLVVKKTIASTDVDDTNYPAESTVTGDATFSISDGQLLIAGNNSIVASYSQGVGNTLQTKTDLVTLTANQITLQSISVDADEMEKAIDSYIEGQSLNLVGLVVSAEFNRTESNRTLALTECKVYFDDTEKYYTSSVYLTDDGKDLIIAFTYAGVTKTATVGELDVAAKVLSSIAVKGTSTNKTNYLIGDKFSTVGLILEATYNDGYEEVVSSGFTTNYDSYKTNAFAQAQVGTNAVTVSLTVAATTKTCTYDIVVGNPSLSNLRFDTSLVNLSVTNGTAFSLAGLVVYGIFENGYEEQLEYTTPNINTELSITDNKVSFASTELGIKTVTVSCSNPYDEFQIPVTKTLDVAVTPNLELMDIRLKFNMTYEPNNYRVGDTFTAKGVTVEALFKDTDWLEVSGWATSNPTLGSLIRSGGRLTVIVSYTSQGIVKSAEYIIAVSMAYDSGVVEENTYKVAFNVASVMHEESTISFSDTVQLPLFHSNAIDVDDDEESPTYGLNVYTGSSADTDCIGYLRLGATSEIDGSVIENGIVVLFDDPVNPIDGDGNIIVKFPHYVAGYADRINQCRFGIIYNNRLFVSGNPNFPNVDWHSTQVNSSQAENYNTIEDKDLTYFSDLDYCKYGSENSAIKGYDIYRDGTLLVFKGKAQHEATIYTRQTQLVNASSFDGNVVSEGELAEEAYPCFPVNPNGGEGAISNYSIINFVGETLVLTRDGIKAITSKESTYNNAKYTYDVSSHVNNRLLKYNDINNVFISQYKEKLLLKTDEGLYIGEFKLRDKNSEYEWYFCDNIDAHYFFELDDELYFSDISGNISRFIDSDNIERKDKPRTYVGLGGTTLQIDANNDVIVISKDYATEVKNGREFHLLSKISAITGNVTDQSQVYAKMGSFIDKFYRQNAIEDNLPTFDQTAWEGIIDSETNRIIIKPHTADGDEDISRKEDILLLFPTNKVVYLDNIVGEIVKVQIDMPYLLKRIANTSGIFDYQFSLFDDMGAEVDLTGIESFRISFRVNNVAVAYIMDVEAYGSEGGKQFKVGLPMKKDEYVALDLINYNNRDGTYQGVITDHVNVESYFITKPFNLDHDLYQKTIHMWSIINDSQIASAMNVGYLVSRKAADFKIAVKEIGGARQLSSERLNFEKLHFTSDKLPHIYTRYKTLPNVGFIRFIFSNDEGTRMVLSRLDIIYSYSLLMKGVN